MRVFVLWGLVLASACLVSPAAQAQATSFNAVAESGDTEIHLTWEMPPAGEMDITGYTVEWYPKEMASSLTSATVPSTVTKHTITGLTNFQEYTITLTTENMRGDGPSTMLSATPRSLPQAPTALMAEPRNMEISLTWEAPEDSGPELTTYKLSWNPPSKGGESSTAVSATITKHTITGLTNGQEYTITLLAENEVGEGPPTELPATPATVPSTPLEVVAEPRNKAINLVWAEPANGGSDLTSYRVAWDPKSAEGASSATVFPSSTGYLITGLTNGEGYTITLSAGNAIGEGPSTELLATPATVPDAPQNVVAEPRNKAINLVWAEPANGGSDLTSYRVAWDPKSAEGASSATVFPSSTGYLITGLTNGEEYTITLSAWNTLGEGPSTRLLATPATVPDAPQNVVAEPRNKAINLIWAAPESDGGSDLTSYRVAWEPKPAEGASSATVFLPSTRYPITGLTNGEEYTITLSAWNRFGEGPSTKLSATPATVPDAPQNVMAEPRNMRISLTWDEPKSDGGSDLATYRLSWTPPNSNDASEVNPGSGLPSSATSYTITGLTNGQKYTITLSAWNTLGEGSSTQVLTTPVGPPTAPLNVAAVAGDTAIGLTWEKPASDGGFALTTYKVSWNPPSRGNMSEVEVLAEHTAAVITGLANDVKHTILVSAWNAVGEGPSTEVFATPQSELDEDLDGVDIASTAGYVIVPGDLASGGAIIETSDLLPEGSRVCIIPEENSAAIYCRQEQEAGDTIVVPAFESKLYGVTGERLISRRIYVAPVIGFSHGTQRCSPNGVNDEVNLDLRLSPTVANTIIGNSNSVFDLEFETVPPSLMATPEVQFNNTGILRVAFTPVEFTNEVKAISVTLATINAVAFVGDKESLSGVKERLIRDKKLFALGNNKVTLLEPKESSTPLIKEVMVDNAAQHSTELITFNKRTTITFTAEYAVKVRRYSTETMILATDRSLSSTATKVVIDIAGSAPMITFDGSMPRGIAGSGSNIFEIVLSSGGESTGISVLGGVPTALSSAGEEGGVTLATPRRGSVVRPGFYAYETSTVNRAGVSSPRITANTLNLQSLPDGRTVADAASDFGVFDFIVSDLVCDVATAALELDREAQQEEVGWTYHKYQQGSDEDGGEWSPFVRMEQDKIFSAPAPCPSAYASREPDEGGSGSYAWHLAHDGIRNEDRCLLLEIEDGSVNDADGRVNKIISDPGTLSEEEDIFGRRSGGGGGGGIGGMDLWWLMLLLGGMVSGTALARRRSASRQRADTDQPSCRFA